MSFQIRATAPDGASDAALGREIARKLEDTALGILAGVAPEHYQAAVARYQAFAELMTFMEERAAALAKGEDIDEE